MNLRETQRTSKLNIDSLKINVNDIVLFFMKRCSNIFGRRPSRDSEISGAIVRIVKTNTILKRPVNKLSAVESTYHDINQTDKASHKEIASSSPFVL